MRSFKHARNSTKPALLSLSSPASVFPMYQTQTPLLYCAASTLPIPNKLSQCSLSRSIPDSTREPEIFSQLSSSPGTTKLEISSQVSPRRKLSVSNLVVLMFQNRLGSLGNIIRKTHEAKSKELLLMQSKKELEEPTNCPKHSIPQGANL